MRKWLSLSNKSSENGLLHSSVLDYLFTFSNHIGAFASAVYYLWSSGIFISLPSILNSDVPHDAEWLRREKVARSSAVRWNKKKSMRMCAIARNLSRFYGCARLYRSSTYNSPKMTVPTVVLTISLSFLFKAETRGHSLFEMAVHLCLRSQCSAAARCRFVPFDAMMVFRTCVRFFELILFDG